MAEPQTSPFPPLTAAQLLMVLQTPSTEDAVVTVRRPDGELLGTTAGVKPQLGPDGKAVEFIVEVTPEPVYPPPPPEPRLVEAETFHLPTPSAPFAMTVTCESFQGVRDDVMNLGYNIAPCSGKKAVPGDAQLKLDFESRFKNPAGTSPGAEVMEVNLDYRGPEEDGPMYHRFLHMEVNRATANAEWQFMGNVLVLSAPAGDTKGVFQGYVLGGPQQGNIPVLTIAHGSLSVERVVLGGLVLEQKDGRLYCNGKKVLFDD